MANTAPADAMSATNLQQEHPELTFNKFVNRLIGPNKLTTYGKPFSSECSLENFILKNLNNLLLFHTAITTPPLSAVNDQEKRIMALFESCPTKCAMSGVGGKRVFAWPPSSCSQNMYR